MKQEQKAWILLGSIFLVFITSMPKKQEKHESKQKKIYGNGWYMVRCFSQCNIYGVTGSTVLIVKTKLKI